MSEIPSVDAPDSVAIVRRLWQYCNVLRDDGLSYPDYVEQLTYLLFLKMSEEQDGDGPVPRPYSWSSLVNLGAVEMHKQYTRILAELGRRPGMLGLIFRNARNKIRDPGKLRLLIAGLIGRTEWTGLSTDVKGAAYEGLLEKNARDTKSGAGQYFTPRALIEAVVACISPKLGEVICDPACGTGGFLLAAHDYLARTNSGVTPADRLQLTRQSLKGFELVEEVARLATMNLLLHGISGSTDSELPIVCMDSLNDAPRETFDIVMTNPPFGVKGSVTYSTRKSKRQQDEGLTIVRSDFWARTANKQLNFVQHVANLLKPGGRAAIIVPDNVLFEGGAATSIRRRLLGAYELHTLLRLPAGLFYAQGVKANVLFFDRPRSGVVTTTDYALWVYDLRSRNRFSLKTKPLRFDDLREFVDLYRRREDRPDRLHDGRDDSNPRWRRFEVAGVLAGQDARLDLQWRGEEAGDSTPGSRLDEISTLIAADLRRALESLERATRGLGGKKTE